MLAAASDTGTFLGIIFLLVAVAGVVGTAALWYFVIRNAPPDGSDIGYHPDADQRDQPPSG